MTNLRVEEAITRAHHQEWARVVAAVTGLFGDLDIAEEAVAEYDVADVRPLSRKRRA